MALVNFLHCSRKYWCIWPIVGVVIAFVLVLYVVDNIFERQTYARWERYSYDMMNKHLELGQILDDKEAGIERMKEEYMSNCSSSVTANPNARMGRFENLQANPYGPASPQGEAIPERYKIGRGRHRCTGSGDRVLVLTPVRNIGTLVKRYFRNLLGLTYPHCRIRVAFGVNYDDIDTVQQVRKYVADLNHNFSSIEVFRLEIKGGNFNPGNVDRHKHDLQLRRRSHLARVRNSLLFQALENETWVLWLDHDLREIPPQVIQALIRSKRDIVVPSCMYRKTPRELAVYDKNSWQETNASRNSLRSKDPNYLMMEGYNDTSRLYLPDLISQGAVVELDGVGACCLLVRADIHRRGVIFPPFIFRNHIETEGFAQLAKVLGYKLYGMPSVQVIH